MAGNETLIDIFLAENSLWLKGKSEELKTAISSQDRDKIMERVAKKGVSFGISVGISAEQRRRGTVCLANKRIYTKWLSQLESDINDYIMDRMLKGKEKKKAPKG